jgi:hypothetical protein
MKGSLRFFAVFMVCLMVLTGCSDSDTPENTLPNPETQTDNEMTSDEEPSSDIYYVTAFTDYLVHIRSKPSTDSEILFDIDAGDFSVRLKDLGDNKFDGEYNWHHVLLPDSRTGWVREDVVVIAGENVGTQTASGAKFEFVDYEDKDRGIKYSIVKGCTETVDPDTNLRLFTYGSLNADEGIQYSISSFPDNNAVGRLQAAESIVTQFGQWPVVSKETNDAYTFCSAISPDKTKMSYHFIRIFNGIELKLNCIFPAVAFDKYYDLFEKLENSLAVVGSSSGQSSSDRASGSSGSGSSIPSEITRLISEGDDWAKQASEAIPQLQRTYFQEAAVCYYHAKVKLESEKLTDTDEYRFCIHALEVLRRNGITP